MTKSQTALPGRSFSRADATARGLGYFSVGLGLIELVSPRLVCRIAGIRGKEAAVRLFGARELATGIALVTTHDATPWIWGRVLGDALDVAAVTASAVDARVSRVVTLASLFAVTAVDLSCAIALSSEKGGEWPAIRNYADRSGFSKPTDEMRGAAKRLKPRKAPGAAPAALPSPGDPAILTRHV